MNNRNYIYLFFLSLSIFLQACAVTINTAANRFDSPEAIGDLIDLKAEKINANLYGSHQANTQFVLTEDYSVHGPNTSNPPIVPDRRVRIGAGIGLDKKIDLEYRLPGGIQFKYQWLGEAKKIATKGNFSLASTVAYDWSTRDSSIKSNSNLFTNRSIKMHEDTFDFAAIAGYRFADYFLIYGGPFIIFDNFRGDYTVNNTTTTSFRGSARTIGANLGYEFSYTSLSLRIEGAYTANRLGSAKRTLLHGGIAFGGQF